MASAIAKIVIGKGPSKYSGWNEVLKGHFLVESEFFSDLLFDSRNVISEIILISFAPYVKGKSYILADTVNNLLKFQMLVGFRKNSQIEEAVHIYRAKIDRNTLRKKTLHSLFSREFMCAKIIYQEWIGTDPILNPYNVKINYYISLSFSTTIIPYYSKNEPITI